MPLIKGKKAKTRQGFSQNVKTEVDALKKKRPGVSKNKLVKQAVAISYSKAGESRNKKKKK